MNVNFVTNLAIESASGGWSGINACLHAQLSHHFSVQTIGPINPPAELLPKFVSKAKRIVGLHGEFHFFSQSRLKRIASLVASQVKRRGEYTFFHGATPWVLYRPEQRYGVYLDASFLMYLEIYHAGVTFARRDVDRIALAERAWLSRASHVFFGSEWARQRTIADYGLIPERTHVVWVGGNVPVPAEDIYDGGLRFLFISLDFEKKGGWICYEAFTQVQKRFPGAILTIVGQQPPAVVLSHPNVEYVGRLNKSIPAQMSMLTNLLAQARALIHPTSMDANPLVLVEAAYYGCPAVSTRRFGIPEFVIDGKTGFLLDFPISVSRLEEIMLQLCESTSAYDAMRIEARRHAMGSFTWDTVGNRIATAIRQSSRIPTLSHVSDAVEQ